MKRFSNLSFRWTLAALMLVLMLALPLIAQAQAAPTISSDKDDYAPGQIVTLTGQNWQPDESVHLFVDDDRGKSWNHNADVTAAGDGTFTYQFQLPDWFVAIYSVTATGAESGTATTTFTDATHNINFATSGLPAGVSIPITGWRYNPAGQYRSYSVTFSSPGPSANTGALDGSSDFTYSGFPASVTVAGITYNLSSTSRPSPFTVPSGAGTTTVTAYYVAACTPPSISAHPSSATKTVGESVSFSVTAGGTAPLSYQWRKGGSNIGGATGSSYSIASVLTSDAGNYDVVVSNACGSATSNAATLTVNKATPTITWSNPADIVYGTALGASQLNATASVPGSFVYSPAAGTVLSAGNNQNLHVDFTPTDTTNYNNASKDVKINVLKKDASVTPNAASKTYGDPDPALTGTLSGFLAADGVTATYSRTLGETVAGSPYTISASLSPAGVLGNYNITYNTANFTINPRPITVTADAKSKVYGNADPALTYQITSGSLVGSDSFSGALTRVAGENVGTYAIQQGTLALSSNYNLTYVGANLTITQRPITVTADAKTKFLGAPDPALTYQITSGSLVNGDTFSGALSRVAGESIGSYDILQGTLTAGSNYNLTFVGAKLTIIYNWSGFFRPVDNLPWLNVAKAGSAIPVKFSLSGNQGLNIFASGFPKSQAIACDTAAPADGIEETVNAGGSSLNYDASADQYIYVWKTDKGWAGTCRQLVVKLNDGTVHQANFNFSK